MSKRVKKAYETVHDGIEKSLLINELKTIWGLESEIREIFSNKFTYSKKGLFKSIHALKTDISYITELFLENFL